MATTGIPVPNTSGNEKEDIRTLVEAALKEHLRTNPGQQDPAVVAPPVENQPLKVTINGTEKEFKSAAELQEAIQQTVDWYNAQLQAVTPPAPQNPNPEKPEAGNGFSKEKFSQLVEGGDILDAIRYANRYALFDGKVDDPGKILQATVAQNAQIQTELAAYKFRDSNPEMRSFMDQNPQATGQLLQIMQSLNLPPTFQGFQAAYSQGVMAGYFPPPQQVVQRFQPQSQSPQDPRQQSLFGRTPPPPALGGGASHGQPSGILEDQFLALPEDKRSELLAYLGSQH